MMSIPSVTTHANPVKPTTSFCHDAMDSVKTAANGLSHRVHQLAKAVIDKLSAIYDCIRPKNPLTGERQITFFPEKWEIAISKYSYKGTIESEGGSWKENPYKKVIEGVMEKLRPCTGRSELPWTIKTIDSVTKNAWSMGGGYLAMYKGLIQKMDKHKDNDFGLGKEYGKDLPFEDKLAAVVAHEMAHVGARHTARSFEFGLFMMAALAPFSFILDGLAFILVEGFTLGRTLLDQSYSRSQEYEADRYGMIMMDKAGYDPKAAVWAQCFLKSIEPSYGIPAFDWIDRWLWNHPDADHRIAANKITLAELENNRAAKAA